MKLVFSLLALLSILSTGHASPQGDAAGEMKAYTEQLPGTKVEIPMVAIPAGSEGFPARFTMGSPAGEEGRGADEGPQREILVEPFWMGKFEITWDIYGEFRREYELGVQRKLEPSAEKSQPWLDAVSIPTPLWEQDSAPILKGLGTTGGYPVANISQFAAQQFTKWLSRKSGHFYRLPTEAEWEYAARAGTATPYHFGSDDAALEEYAWYFDNSAYDDLDKGYPGEGAGYRKIGGKKANPWGLHDMYGNVSEWVLDAHDPGGYAEAKGPLAWSAALVWPKEIFPCVVRGGNWSSEASGCRSAARLASEKDWQYRDPQLPKSIWWFTDGFHVGFRVVRPLRAPSVEEQQCFWDAAGVESIQEVLNEGGKQVRVPIAPAGDGEKR